MDSCSCQTRAWGMAKMIKSSTQLMTAKEHQKALLLMVVLGSKISHWAWMGLASKRRPKKQARK